MTSTGSAQALTDAQLAQLSDLLGQLKIENEADLLSARKTITTLAEEHATVDPTVHEVMTNAEYMVADASSILAKIARAEEKIAQGTYGKCENCGQPIAFERLELRPYIPTCIQCSQ